MSSTLSSLSKKIIPLVDRVLVRRIAAADKTSSGILLPEKAQEKSHKGMVMAVGPGKDGGEKMFLKEGDMVLLPDYGGIPVNALKGESDLILLKEGEILAKLL